ncbi:MAG: IS4 family transposase [Flavobacterium sp.]|nr:IS4 family transposase [Flavobacterium sp.]
MRKVMKNNASLKLSHLLKEEMSKNLLPLFYDSFISVGIDENPDKKFRDRVFNQADTFLTMIGTSIQADKSLQNSVNIFSMIHDENIKRITAIEQSSIAAELANPKRGAGRPRKNFTSVPKSKLKSISSNTSAFAQARDRLSIAFTENVFKHSCKPTITDNSQMFFGRPVYMTDGTYLQMQDTDKIKEVYRPAKDGGYPRALLSLVVKQGCGLISNFRLGSDCKSELEYFAEMIFELEKGSLLLADDLYNCFAIFILLKQKNVDIIVPGKRNRNYEVVKILGKGDEIVKINLKNDDSKIAKLYDIKEKSVLLRRIEYKTPNTTDGISVLYTSILDEKISKEDIILKYITRWDIEINIREIKTIFGLNIMRSKTPEMALKELLAGLIAYNYIRNYISEIAFKSDFSPERDIYEKFYTSDKPVFTDKLGRVYNKLSTGRPKKTE